MFHRSEIKETEIAIVYTSRLCCEVVVHHFPGDLRPV